MLGLYFACVVCLGCQNPFRQVGPNSITADRVPYNNAVAHSWKEQALLNIVKLRYAEPPFFVDVPQIVSGYGLEQRVSGRIGLQSAQSPGIPSGDRILSLVGANATWSDRPTITYSPQTNSEFIRNLTAPIPPEAILLLLESGYSVDAVFALSVQSINGVRNKTVTAEVIQPSDPEFLELVDMLREAQVSGDFGVRTETVERNGKPTESIVIRFAETPSSPEMAEVCREIKRILGAEQDINRFSVIFGDTPGNKNQIAIKTRPIYLILRDLSPFVNVPDQHVTSGVAIPFDTSLVSLRPLQVHCGCDPPRDAFATVQYRDCCYWINSNDTDSKRTFNYLLLLLALADTAPKQAKPTVTIQAN